MYRRELPLSTGRTVPQAFGLSVGDNFARALRAVFEAMPADQQDRALRSLGWEVEGAPAVARSCVNCGATDGRHNISCAYWRPDGVDLPDGAKR